MPIFNSGGGQVGSSQITDGAIVNADVNAAAAIALSKLEGMIGNPGDFLSIETSVGTTHSLTTVAGQKVLVFAKGNVATGGGSNRAVTLAYNGVTKDTVNVLANSSAKESFCLMYTEIPGAGTQNVTVSIVTDTVENVVIFVVKLKTS